MWFYSSVGHLWGTPACSTTRHSALASANRSSISSPHRSNSSTSTFINPSPGEDATDTNIARRFLLPDVLIIHLSLCLTLTFIRTWQLEIDRLGRGENRTWPSRSAS